MVKRQYVLLGRLSCVESMLDAFATSTAFLNRFNRPVNWPSLLTSTWARDLGRWARAVDRPPITLLRRTEVATATSLLMARYNDRLDLRRAALLLESLTLPLPLSRLLACCFSTASLRGVPDTVISALGLPCGYRAHDDGRSKKDVRDGCLAMWPPSRDSNIIEDKQLSVMMVDRYCAPV
jgi:hypothetical protein